MSRAFTHERDDAPEPEISSHVPHTPVRLTSAGRVRFDERLARAASAPERRRLEALARDIVIVMPPGDAGIAAFGATVDVRDMQAGLRRFTLVGEEEADVAAGRISETSPLGRALLGARVGDEVVWHRPAGDLILTLEAIAYEDVAPG